MNKLTFIALIALSLSFIAFGGWWTVYKYNDCIKVGHSKVYCIGKVFMG